MRRGLIGELRVATLHGATLYVEVELALQAPLELASEGRRRIRNQEREPAFGKLGQVFEDVEIGGDHLVDSGPSDLQRDHATVKQDGPVNLRDRRRGRRHLIDRQKELRQRPAQLLGDDLRRLLERKWPDIVAQRGELAGIRLVEQIMPRAQKLTQLHEGWAQVLAYQSEPPRPVMRRDLVPQRHSFKRPDQPFEMKAQPPHPDTHTASRSPGSDDSAADPGDVRRSLESKAKRPARNGVVPCFNNNAGTGARTGRNCLLSRCAGNKSVEPTGPAPSQN